MRNCLILLVGIALLSVPAFGQQSTGSVSGTVTLTDGTLLPGVVITANGEVLPRPRVTSTDGTGRYSLPLLPPGTYELSYTMGDMETQVRQVQVNLEQDLKVDVLMDPETVSESIVVLGSTPVIDTSSQEIKSTISADVILALPVGQEYRDLVKLIPGVQYTEDSTRGPSAGGSGQDNVYLFDGVNVGRPLFGSLSAEPSSHDVDQVAVVKGGANAIDFNRSGGFTINTISKTGTNQWHGALSYQVQTEGMTGSRDTITESEFESDMDWTVVSLGGPVLKERLFFYGSYYRPTTDRTNRANLYGVVPDSASDRDEFFGKFTVTPTDSLLLNFSYRGSDRTDTGLGVTDEASAGSTSAGSDTALQIGIIEASWVVNSRSYFSAKYTDYSDENFGRPDNLFGFDIALDGSVGLDVNALDTQGLFLVPQPVDGDPDFNAFIDPLVQRYGYSEGGVQVGGGRVGGASTISDQDFFREGFQVGYDFTVSRHDLHVGYQYSKDEEDLSRTSNGWGVISVIGGRDFTADGQAVFYEGRFEQQSIADENGDISGSINSQFESQNIELNDTIRLDKFTVNIGVLFSNDKLFGQGLKPNSSNASGFELAPGNKYLMHEDDFGDMIQPRLGVNYSKNGKDSIYASFARYHPAASSLPRAASWARNLRRSIDAQFDAAGNLIGVDPVRSSSGKYFQDGLDPRSIDEIVVGYSKQITPRWTGNAYGRYRKGKNFWEDTNNDARSRFEPPPGIPTEDYIPELDEFRDEIGGSSYVIAELDNAFTKYYEANVDVNWRGTNAYFNGSYVWSHYYGNFDQDNSTTSNDADIFVGSSFIADGAGRQLWDFRYGNLRGDRRHQFKMYGYYNFKWNGSAGAYAVLQSGQPWETWDVEVYRHLTGSSSDTSRYAEPAGSRTTSTHHQLDLNYTQNFTFGGRYKISVRADVFNVYDNQTGYNIQNKKNSSGFGDPRDSFNPRRLQLMLRLDI